MICQQAFYWSRIFLIGSAFSLIYIAIAAATTECPGKDVNEIRGQAEEFELSLVLYHVAWCNDSRAARNVFEDVAHLYQQQVYFAVVDCYHLACNCSRTHPMSLGMGIPNKWPTLMVHYGHRISLQYHGEWSFPALTRFLDKLYQPVVRIHSKEELKLLTMQSDAVVLGLFADANRREYGKFVSAAIKWLETDPESSFLFAVAFGAAADAAIDGDEKLPLILLISPRGVEVYSSTVKWNASNIVMWVQMELKRSFGQLNGYSTPTDVLTQLRFGPVLAIFGNDHFYEHIKSATNLSSVLLTNDKKCTLSLYDHEWACGNELFHLRHDMDMKQLLQPTYCHRKGYISEWNLQHYYTLNTYLDELFCSVSPSCITSTNDALSTNKLLQLFQRNKCFRYTHSAEPSMKILIAKHLKKSLDMQWQASLSHRNRSLTVVLLDNDKHKDFLEAQKITLNQSSSDKNDVTALIVDSAKESVFLLQNQFTYDALLKFVRNYYNHLLTAHKPSSVYRAPIPAAASLLHQDKLNREMFLSVVQQQNTTTVVLLYSPECAFSALMSQALIQVTAMFDPTTTGIRIARLNTQTDELPWEFVMPTTPTLIVFPRGRASESRVFPAHLKVDVRNVFGFILAQLEPIDQLKVVLSCCTQLEEQPQRLRKCLQFAKTLATQHIANHLKLWQIYESERDILLNRLKEFKDISLDIKRNFCF